MAEHLSPSAAPAAGPAELAKPVPQNGSLPDGARSCGRQWRDYKVAAVCITRLSAGGKQDPSSGTGFVITGAGRREIDGSWQRAFAPTVVVLSMRI